MELEDKIKKVTELRKALADAETDLNGGEASDLGTTVVGLTTFQINGKWFVAQLDVNPAAGTATISKTHPCEDKGTAAEKFKIEAAGWLEVFQENL